MQNSKKSEKPRKFQKVFELTKKNIEKLGQEINIKCRKEKQSEKELQGLKSMEKIREKI